MESWHESGPGQGISNYLILIFSFIPKHAVKFCQKSQSGLGYTVGDSGRAPPMLQKETQRGGVHLLLEIRVLVTVCKKPYPAKQSV